MKRVFDFLDNSETYFLATSEGGHPRVRPFGTVDIFEGRLYIQTGRSKSCYAQMKDDPRIEICAMEGGRWIRISANAVEDDSIEAQRHMLDRYPQLSGMYKPGDGNTAVFFLENAHAVISSFTEAPVEIDF